MALSRALRPLASICSDCSRRQHLQSRLFTTSLHRRNQPETTSALPRIAQPSLWTSLIPKPFRRQEIPTSESAQSPPLPSRNRFLTRPRDWNPATIFILLGLLVGSNAIQLLTLRNSTQAFTRETDAKLSLLREVIRRVKAGEEVNVRGMLGTGIKEMEDGWEEVVKELESGEGLRRDGGRQGREARDAKSREGGGGGGVGDGKGVSAAAEEKGIIRPKFVM